MVTSPLARARQTAEIVADRLGLRRPACWATRASAWGSTCRPWPPSWPGSAEDPRHILLVGHEPGFSSVIGELTGGAVVMRKGALARVDLQVGRRARGELVWLLQPRLLLTCQAGRADDAPAPG